MMKGILLLLIATFHTSPMGAKYLLVQFEEARDERIENIGATAGVLAAIPHIIGAIPHQGKHIFRKSYPLE